MVLRLGWRLPGLWWGLSAFFLGIRFSLENVQLVRKQGLGLFVQDKLLARAAVRFTFACAAFLAAGRLSRLGLWRGAVVLLVLDDSLFVLGNLDSVLSFRNLLAHCDSLRAVRGVVVRRVAVLHHVHVMHVGNVGLRGIMMRRVVPVGVRVVAVIPVLMVVVRVVRQVVTRALAVLRVPVGTGLHA